MGGWVGPTPDVHTLNNSATNKPLSTVMQSCRLTHILLTVLKYPDRTVCMCKCVQYFHCNMQLILLLLQVDCSYEWSYHSEMNGILIIKNVVFCSINVWQNVACLSECLCNDMCLNCYRVVSVVKIYCTVFVNKGMLYILYLECYV